MEKIIDKKEAVAHIKDGMTVLVGGFLGVGTPHLLVDELLAQGTKDLTLVGNDTSFPDNGVGKLVVAKRAKKIIATHIGTNAETGRQLNEGETEVVLVPQGTLAEQIRAGGAGLGGILTPTGVGTVVQEGKQVIELNGHSFLLEEALKGDIALIKASKADKKGNLVFEKAARNFNPMMATAADIVIVEADEIVEVGDIDPDQVMIPHIFVDYIVKGVN